MHLIIDGYATDPAKTDNLKFIYEFLDAYPRQIGMTKVSTPQVSEYQDPTSQEQGISGFVLLAESHISIHSFPNRAYINIDVFSCSEFESKDVIAALQQQFGLVNVSSYVLNRPHSGTE